MSVRSVVTPEKIDLAVRRLVEAAQPTRIILFGSAARGDMHEHSDVDLLVVLPDEPTSLGDVQRRIERALVGIQMPRDILVISEERLAELGDRPSLVYREALREGKVIYEATQVSPRRRGRKMRTPSQAGLPHTWLAHARSDLAVARATRNNPDIFGEQICFHAQQAAEKAIKAVLLARNVDFPYTHNLTDLVAELTSRGLPVSADVTRASELSRYAVDTRYPHADEITESDVDEAIEIAEGIVGWAIPLVPTPSTTT